MMRFLVMPFLLGGALAPFAAAQNCFNLGPHANDPSCPPCGPQVNAEHYGVSASQSGNFLGTFWNTKNVPIGTKYYFVDALRSPYAPCEQTPTVCFKHYANGFIKIRKEDADWQTLNTTNIQIKGCCTCFWNNLDSSGINDFDIPWIQPGWYDFKRTIKGVGGQQETDKWQYLVRLTVPDKIDLAVRSFSIPGFDNPKVLYAGKAQVKAKFSLSNDGALNATQARVRIEASQDVSMSDAIVLSDWKEIGALAGGEDLPEDIIYFGVPATMTGTWYLTAFVKEQSTPVGQEGEWGANYGDRTKVTFAPDLKVTSFKVLKPVGNTLSPADTFEATVEFENVGNGASDADSKLQLKVSKKNDGSGSSVVAGMEVVVGAIEPQEGSHTLKGSVTMSGIINHPFIEDKVGAAVWLFVKAITTQDSKPGNNTSDLVKLTVTPQLELVLHRSKVMDPNETALSEESKFTQGAQSWVNLDNDDLDETFDLQDVDVSVTSIPEVVDNELNRLKLKIRKPAGAVGEGSVRLNVIQGVQNVALWEGAHKQTPFVPETSVLVIPDDFTLEGEDYVKELWVEGIAAHSHNERSEIEMVYTLDDKEYTDKVAIAILGIRKLLWGGKQNGFTPSALTHDSDSLDLDPNFPVGENLPLAYRVFADARAPYVNTPRDRVALSLELTRSPVEAVNIYLRPFDIDDPASVDPTQGPEHPSNLVDPNDLGGSGIYSGATIPFANVIPYTSYEDNRGSVGGHKAGLFVADSWGNPEWNTYAVHVPAGDFFKAVDFQVSHHPGDNYRVAVSGDPYFLAINLANHDASAGYDIEDTSAGKLPPPASASLSDALTVWRLLHVEADSMEAVHTSGPEKNFVEGLVTKIGTANGELNGQPVSLSFLTLNVDLTSLMNGLDYSLNLDGIPIPQQGLGRFEKGRIEIGLSPTATESLLGNGVSSVWKIGAFNIPCELAKGSQTLKTNLVSWEGLFIELQQADPQFAGGTISIGGFSTTILAVLSANLIQVGNIPDIPFKLWDDDKATLPQEFDFSGMGAFEQAYVLAVNDGGGGFFGTQDVPFILNLPQDHQFQYNFFNSHRGSKGNESDSFWTVHVVQAYQGSQYDFSDGFIKGDMDPNLEKYSGSLAVTGALTADGYYHNSQLSIGGGYSYFLGEEIREAMLLPEGFSIKRSIAHEVGHQFGLGHGDESTPGGQVPEFPNVGIMHPAVGGTLSFPGPEWDKFSERQVNLIRSRVRSPGE